MKIITVTLSPTYDIFYSIPSFKPFSENIASTVKRFTGGKGINVSRALLAVGVQSRAVMLLGRENGDAFLNAVRSDGLDTVPVFADGSLRESITVLSDAGETRINYNAFSASMHDLDNVLDTIKNESDGKKGDEIFIICSGRFPSGISPEDKIGFILSLKKVTPFVALDSASFNCDETASVKPWFIKPNELEAELMTGLKPSDTDSALSIAEKIRGLGIGNVMLSLGERGAVYCGELGTAVIKVPEITPVSTVGAGDSTLAGFVSAYAESRSGISCLKQACALGTAACLTAGTLPPQKKDIDGILNEISVSFI